MSFGVGRLGEAFRGHDDGTVRVAVLARFDSANQERATRPRDVAAEERDIASVVSGEGEGGFGPEHDIRFFLPRRHGQVVQCLRMFIEFSAVPFFGGIKVRP